MTIQPQTWDEVAQQKQAANLALIPAEWRIKTAQSVHVLDVPTTCGVLSAAELEITETPAAGLVERMRKGELNAYDVNLAFAKRASVAHQLVSPVVARAETDQLPLGNPLRGGPC
jgi:amidase